MYYGIDSDTAVFPTGATTKDFYAGRIGYGTTADSRYFNITGAGLASKVYGYWGVKGHLSDPNYSLPYSVAMAQNWGAAQAAAAITARTNVSKINRQTIFADIEQGFGGWAGNGSDLDWGVLVGFINRIHSAGLKCGIYTSRGSWTTIMGTNVPLVSGADVLWGANDNGTYSFNNPPTTMSGCYSINGNAPTMWQYHLELTTHDPNLTGDANIATSLPI